MATKKLRLSKKTYQLELLAEAQRLQTEFWDALRELETELDVEIDSNNDLETETIASLKKAGK